MNRVKFDFLPCKGRVLTMSEALKALDNLEYRNISLDYIKLMELFLGGRPENVRAYSNPNIDTVKIRSSNGFNATVSKTFFKSMITPEGTCKVRFYFLYSE